MIPSGSSINPKSKIITIIVPNGRALEDSLAHTKRLMNMTAEKIENGNVPAKAHDKSRVFDPWYTVLGRSLDKSLWNIIPKNADTNPDARSKITEHEKNAPWWLLKNALKVEPVPKLNLLLTVNTTITLIMATRHCIPLAHKVLKSATLTGGLI
ncbi:hypothetical protein OXX79_014290, partial [Metschnikowia pulcherrima]